MHLQEKNYVAENQNEANNQKKNICKRFNRKLRVAVSKSHLNNFTKDYLKN